MYKKVFILCSSLIFLVGCLGVPKLEVREIKSSSDIIHSSDRDTSSSIFRQSDWWKIYGDRNLDELIDYVFKHNLDLEIAKLNIEKSQHYIELVAGENGPNLNFAGAFERKRLDFMELPIADGKKIINIYDLQLTGNYTFDFFGKLKAMEREATLKREAAILKRDFIKLKLATETINLFGYWNYLLAEESNLKMRSSTLKEMETLLEKSISLGIGTSDKLLRIREETGEVEMLLEENTLNRDITINSLNLLSGMEIHDEIIALLPKNHSSKLFEKLDIPSSISSEVLANRPDIQFYLYNIEAQKEKLKSLESDFYPQFVIDGNIGFSALTAGSLLHFGALNGVLSPKLLFPIFRGNQIKNNYQIGGTDLNIFIEQYNSTLLNSVKNVNDALNRVKTQDRKISINNRVFNEQTVLLERGEKRESLGSLSRLSLLNERYIWSQASLRNAQEQLFLFNEQLNLMNALGGSYGK